MLVKDLAISIKAGPEDDLPEGTFTAYASVFGNVDAYGDRVVKGAFSDDLARWSESGAFIPLLFGHQMSDPDFNIGHVASAEEDDRGLKVTAVLDLENPKSVQVYRMLKGRRINQMSFAYDVLDSRQVSADEGDDEDDEGAKMRRKGNEKINELLKLKLYEVSVVTIGANQDTEILAVKAAGAVLEKAGRAISSRNEASLKSVRSQLVAAAETIQGVLAQVAAGDDEPKSGQPTGADKGEASGGQVLGQSASDDAGLVARRASSVETPKPGVEPSVSHLLLSLKLAEASGKG